MPRPAKTSITLALVTLVTACSGTGVGEVSTTVTTSPNVSSSTSTLPPVVDCPGAGEFGEGGAIAVIDGEGSDSSNLGQISWSSSDQCESFDFLFETSEGAPATSVPEIRVDHLESFQVLRIRMDIAGAVLSDQLVESGLVSRLYVVGALGGGWFVDLHLRAPAAARARVESSPARLTIDLRPGLVSFEGGAVVGDDTVVVSPAGGTKVDTLTQFMGYARRYEDEMKVIVTQEEAVVTEASVPSVATETWGEFQEQILLPAGEVSVFLGTIGETGPDGITVDLTAS